MQRRTAARLETADQQARRNSQDDRVGAAKPEMKVSVVIPAFNERATIEQIVCVVRGSAIVRYCYSFL
jgi:hypothetical protein